MLQLKNIITALLVVGAAGGVCYADEWEAPSWADTLVNPVNYDSSTAIQAQTLYQKNCAVCHGVTGQGDGMMAKGMQPPPTNFAGDPDLLNDPVGELFWKIKTGKKPMPKWGKELTDKQIWMLVYAVREFCAAVAVPDNAGSVKPDSSRH